MKLLNFLATSVLAVSGAVFAQASSDPAASGASSAAASSAPMSEGEVRKVDKDTGKLTLRHGPLVNLDMGPMTMVFRVSDPQMLDTVKQGDKVRFVAERVNGQFTVTRIEAAK